MHGVFYLESQAFWPYSNTVYGVSLNNFPSLQLRREFKSVAALTSTAGSLMDSWPEWREKVIQLAKLESATRPVLKVLGDLEGKDSVVCPDGECFNTFYVEISRLHGCYVFTQTTVMQLVWICSQGYCIHEDSGRKQFSSNTLRYVYTHGSFSIR